MCCFFFFFFQAEDGIRDLYVTGVQTCALPISVFSVANIMKPGSFDMATIQSLETPAIAFFLTLPAPIPALDAWETMLPTAERMAELLNGVLLDESRNALGRQRIRSEERRVGKE